MSAQQDDISWLFAICAIALLIALVALVAFRKRIEKKIPDKASMILRPILVVVSIVACFFFIELPYNRDIFAMDASFMMLNISILGAALLAVYFAAGRSRIALAVFMIACFIAGMANGFVVEFRGQPVLVSDILALSTAAEVATGYTYVILDEMFFSMILLEVLLCALTLLHPIKITKMNIMPSISVAALFVMALSMWYNTVGIYEEYDCSVDAWSSRESYEAQGAVLCLLQRAQELTPAAPDSYTPDEADRMRALTADPFIDSSSDAEAEGSEESIKPSIVVIMNETFSDISIHSAIDASYPGPYRFYEARDDALLSGNVYVSALGGSTCNSEYEFLTGASVGLLGPGIYPYMLYSMKGVENMASYLSSLGYDTTAIHPAEATNWRRNIIYEQMGFDTFYDIESMRDSETIRGLVTDAVTYDIVLDILSSDDEPQFIFDVTIANHGGYHTEEIPENEQIHASINGVYDQGVDEYVSLIERSDIEFAAFLDDIEKLDRPVVVCMFGDHQSGYADILAELSTGTEIKDMTLEQAQTRFVTPYMIWTNSEEIRQSFGTGIRENMGLSYLSANVLRAAGLPLSEQFAFVYGIQQKLPAVNLNGYMDIEGVWHYHGEESISSDDYEELKYVQYRRLFDR